MLQAGRSVVNLDLRPWRLHELHECIWCSSVCDIWLYPKPPVLYGAHFYLIPKQRLWKFLWIGMTIMSGKSLTSLIFDFGLILLTWFFTLPVRTKWQLCFLRHFHFAAVCQAARRVAVPMYVLCVIMRPHSITRHASVKSPAVNSQICVALHYSVNCNHHRA